MWAFDQKQPVAYNTWTTGNCLFKCTPMQLKFLSFKLLPSIFWKYSTLLAKTLHNGHLKSSHVYCLLEQHYITMIVKYEQATCIEQNADTERNIPFTGG